MRFRPPWPLLALYVVAVTATLLTLGPASRIYFVFPWSAPAYPQPESVPALAAPGGAAGGVDGLNGHAAPGAGPPAGGPPPPDAKLTPSEWWARHVVAPLRDRALSTDILKNLLKAVVPGLRDAGAGADSGLAVEGLSLRQLLLRGFEVAGGVQLGSPWTLLAAELPALRLVEMPEAGPLAVSLQSVLPQWQYRQPATPDAADAPAGPEARGPGGGAGSEGGRPATSPATTVEVVVYHTHGTEAYLGPAAASPAVNPGTVGFSPDPEQNIMQVGTQLARTLQVEGVSSVHVAELFDYRSGLVTRAGAYLRSLQMLERFQDGNPVTAAYPQMRLLLDIHRDAIPRDKALVEVNGRLAGRIAAVIGARNNPYWESSLCLAQRLHELMEERYPGLSRGVMVRHDARFNQHLIPGALLYEIGSVENTLAEARASAEMLGQVLAHAVREGIVPAAGESFRCP